MKMELLEGSETSAIRNQTPGNYPKENILRIEHGESLKPEFGYLMEATTICFHSKWLIVKRFRETGLVFYD